MGFLQCAHWDRWRYARRNPPTFTSTTSRWTLTRISPGCQDLCSGKKRVKPFDSHVGGTLVQDRFVFFGAVFASRMNNKGQGHKLANSLAAESLILFFQSITLVGPCFRVHACLHQEDPDTVQNCRLEAFFCGPRWAFHGASSCRTMNHRFEVRNVCAEEKGWVDSTPCTNTAGEIEHSRSGIDRGLQ